MGYRFEWSLNSKFLDLRRQKQDGNYSVRFLVSHSRRLHPNAGAGWFLQTRPSGLLLDWPISECPLIVSQAVEAPSTQRRLW